jgi:hypothetical protein
VEEVGERLLGVEGVERVGKETVDELLEISRGG